MPIHRKSPVHNTAAMLSQVHPSPATWVIFERNRYGEFNIVQVGQFLTDFLPGNNQYDPQHKALFRTTAGSSPYGQPEDWYHTLTYLGLVPIHRFPRLIDGWYEAMPPAHRVRSHYGSEFLVPDRRDPYTFWEPTFIVKIQNAHKVLGCTPGEFRRVLAEFYHQTEAFRDYLQDEDDAIMATEDA